jgi:membrane associated rhomboid family serine protease
VIPLKDDNPTRSVPFVTVVLILANTVVFVYQLLLPPEASKTLIAGLGLTPALLTEAILHDPGRLGHAGVTLLTAMFLHGGILHVALNMLYLWIFGNNIEDVMGHGRFVLFYLGCGLIASLTQVAAAPHSRIPMIGASGAISGVLGAYLVMFPVARVLTLVFLIFFVRVVSFPAVIVLGFWFLLQLISAGQMSSGGGVAVLAHIGGFVTGLVLIPAFRRRRSRQSLY